MHSSKQAGRMKLATGDDSRKEEGGLFGGRRERRERQDDQPNQPTAQARSAPESTRNNNQALPLRTNERAWQAVPHRAARAIKDCRGLAKYYLHRSG